MPNICLATRHRIDLDDQKKRDYLEILWENIKNQNDFSDEDYHPFSAEDVIHAKNTDRIRKEVPLYFSFCKISRNQQKVVATEPEFCEGG